MNQSILKKYLAGDATQDEKEELMKWVKADSANMSELTAYRKLYDLTVWQQNEELPVSAARRDRRRLRLYQLMSVASIFLLLIGVGLYIFYPRTEVPVATMQTIRVPAGQRVEVTLTDGTNVWLNAGTTFSFPNYFAADRREVTIDGEGYFDVHQNPEHPFIVKTNAHDIRVLGTTFNVLAYSKHELFEVALLEGALEIITDAGSQPVYLEPHTRVYKSGNRLTKGKIVNYNNLLWKDGLICFDNELVDVMISKLELYFDVKVVVLNESFRKRKYTGKFRTKDGIEHIFRVFQLKDKFTYERDDDLNVITIR